MAWVAAGLGLAGYNWWILAALMPGLIGSPSELFSNLEVTGQPYAVVWQRADIAGGALLLVAFLAAGRRVSGRGERIALLAFALAAMIGGAIPQSCPDGLSPGCRALEYQLRLPVSSYRHDALGIAEFVAISIALILAARRTRDEHTTVALIYRALARAGIVAYPLLGLAYLANRYGAVMEAVFFSGFTVIVATQIYDRTRVRQPVPDRCAGVGVR